MKLVSGNVHYYRRFMMEENRYALKLELCCLSHVLAQSFHLKYKDIVSILGTKYGRVGWTCGSIRPAFNFTSVALLHVGFVYCLRKRLFLSCTAPQALFPCCGEGRSPGGQSRPHRTRVVGVGPTDPPPYLHSPTAPHCHRPVHTDTDTEHSLSDIIAFGDFPKGCPGPAEKGKGKQGRHGHGCNHMALAAFVFK